MEAHRSSALAFCGLAPRSLPTALCPPPTGEPRAAADGIMSYERRRSAAMQKLFDFNVPLPDTLQDDLEERFQHLGASTARMFLWSAGYELTPNAEEKKWMAKHK